ncbi:MAG: hypothetical protein GX940_05840 [Clostridiaceae bacterium]|nr:hypothetical protein [Clostridiaceae bacterium]
MRDHYIVRQPQPPFGGTFGLFQPGQFFPPGQGPGFFPPGQGPGSPPGQGPGFPPGQGPGTGPPPGRPPAFVPQQAQAQQTTGVFAVDPGSIRRCMFRYVYIWLDNGQQFWAWLIFVGRNSVAGWRWIGFRWVYFGIDLNRIASFICF